MARTKTLQTVGKTVRVLEAFLHVNSGHATLSRLAEELKWSKAATHQYLSSLVEAGWLQQNDDRRYELSSKAAYFGRFAADWAGIPAPIPPVMKDLVKRIGEPISFAVRSGREALIVERYEPRRPLTVGREAERRMPLNSASGQVLLAFDPHVGYELQEHQEILQAVRMRGYSQTKAKWMGDAIEAVAVPIMQDGECLGALSAIAPEGRMKIQQAVAHLTDARERIETSLISSAAAKDDSNEKEA